MPLCEVYQEEMTGPDKKEEMEEITQADTVPAWVAEWHELWREIVADVYALVQASR